MKKVDTKGMERRESGGAGSRVRRTHSKEFKARVVEASQVQGASVAGVALAHGVNANLVRKWIMIKRGAPAPAVATRLLPVHIMTATASRLATMRSSAASPHGEVIEIDVAGARIRVRAGFDAGTLCEVVLVLRSALTR